MYNHKQIEKKWQNYWKKNKTFKIKNDFSKPKYYCLDMFPYPSGAGLHVGHPEGYTANDILARYKNARGFNVLHPMGWDAFGLPAENYAIKTGTHPRITTDENINNFRRQIKELGFSYDWDREIDTTDPKYYKWTEWIFLKLFEKGLAYEQDLPINYCPSCKTGLANEEVLNDFSCERCNTKVEKKKIRQWVLAITKYAERLLADVDKLDWPEAIKQMQRNWIGKSEGCEFEMKKATKKGELPTPIKGGHNVLAKFSSIKSIFENTKKVKSNFSFKGKISINGVLETDLGNISFSSENILKHFKNKNKKEMFFRKKLLSIIFSNISEIKFENEVGYLIFKKTVIKIVLGKQSNGNYFVKSYYKAYQLTKKYLDFAKTLEKDTSKISVYTTRIDTVFGMTYAVLAPDHPKVSEFITEKQKKTCKKYIENANSMSDQDRTAENKEKTGVFTGSYVINPFNDEQVPLWIGDYVLGNYGTGAVMAVPAHDERDFEFAKKYGLEIRQSIAKSFEYSGTNAPKKGVKTLKRKTVDIILENELGEILLEIENHSNGKHIHLIGGGIEEGQTELEAVGAEIIEETGYTDFEIVGPVNLSYAKSLGYRANKNKNQDCLGRAFHVKLKSNKQISSEIEQGKHTIKWLEKNKVAEEITWTGHIDFWKWFYEGEKAFTDHGVLVNSGDFDGLESKKAQTKLIEFAETNGFGKKKLNYKLRDWLFSRQRYWGEPIPLIHLKKENVEKLEKYKEIKDKKNENCHSLKKEGVTRNGDTTKFSFDYIIFEKIKKVKRNVGKHKFHKIISEVKAEKGLITFNGKKLDKHFSVKKRREYEYRKRFGETILKNLNNIVYETDLLGYIIIYDRVFRIVLEKTGEKKYELKTYYSSLKYTKKFNTAYIKQKKDSQYLWVRGKEFSKIYDGIYTKIVCDYNLPIKLPEIKNYKPSGDGNSPLAKLDSFVNIKLAENLSGKRETNTMPQWGGSCWYYLRFMDPKNDEKLVDPKVEKYWGQVDSYVGGAEHAVLHLLYARFWHKFLFDIGVVSHDEPFYRLRNQGLIQSHVYDTKKGQSIHMDLVEEKDGKYFHKETGETLEKKVGKMSKSLGNVVNPDDIIKQYGADSLRLYEMYMADFKDSAPWDSKGIVGVRRFLDKVNKLFSKQAKISSENDEFTVKLLHKTIKKVGEDIENYKFNTAIASMMILVNNGLPKGKQDDFRKTLLIILSPFAPHLSEELWEQIQEKQSIFFAPWPKYDEKLVIDDVIKIAVQVLGKLRGEIEISIGEDKESVLEKAKQSENVAKWLEGKELVKEIYVPGKIVNFVVK